MTPSISLVSLLLLLIASPSVAAGYQTGQEPGQLIDPLVPLQWLTGYCWVGEAGDRQALDTHCYQARMKGTQVIDRHFVADTPAYCGETIFHFAPPQFRDEEDGAILFRYYNIVGAVSDGLLESEGSTLLFPEEIFEDENGNELVFRTWLMPVNDRTYDLVGQQKNGTIWREVHRVRYNRVESRAWPFPNGYQACAR